MYVIKLILINYVFIIISYWNKGMITSNPFLQGGYSSSLNISERPNERYYFPYTKKNIMKPGFLVSTGNQSSRVSQPSYDPRSPYSTLSSYVNYEQPKIGKIGTPILNPFHRSHLLQNFQGASSKYSYGDYQTYRNYSAGGYSVYQTLQKQDSLNQQKCDSPKKKPKKKDSKLDNNQSKNYIMQHSEVRNVQAKSNNVLKVKQPKQQDYTKNPLLPKIISNKILQNIYGIDSKTLQKNNGYTPLNEQGLGKLILSDDQDPLNEDYTPSFIMKKDPGKKHTFGQKDLKQQIDSPRWAGQQSSKIKNLSPPSTIVYKGLCFYLIDKD